MYVLTCFFFFPSPTEKCGSAFFKKKYVWTNKIEYNNDNTSTKDYELREWKLKQVWNLLLILRKRACNREQKLFSQSKIGKEEKRKKPTNCAKILKPRHRFVKVTCGMREYGNGKHNRGSGRKMTNILGFFLLRVIWIFHCFISLKTLYFRKLTQNSLAPKILCYFTQLCMNICVFISLLF